MAYLHFELNESDDRKQEFKAFLKAYSEACRACAEFVLRALELMSVSQAHNGKFFPGIVFLFCRHVAEELDAISVLAMEGCAEPCKAHLRSAFEAELGILYILEEKSEERALAFHVAEIHKRIRATLRFDPSTEQGKQVRKDVAHDKIGSNILASPPQIDFKAEVLRLEARLRTPTYDAVDQEWQRTAQRLKKKRPSWYSLFDGPLTIRDLAYHVQKGFWYEFLYGDLSETVHAASAFRHVARMSGDNSGEANAVRPLRHPDGLRTVCNLASVIATETEQAVGSTFLGPVAKTVLHDQYLNEVRPRMMEIDSFGIGANWA